MIAAQMGNTRYRGRIVWMLLTSRPDLLPIDLKRQGRAEVHIPLFYPYEDAELRQMFEVMARKNKLKLAADVSAEDLRAAAAERGRRGEHRAGGKARSPHRRRDELTSADIDGALAEFIPSAQGLEKELQETAAVLECTQMSLLPPQWREKISGPEGRSRLQERMVAIRQILES